MTNQLRKQLLLTPSLSREQAVALVERVEAVEADVAFADAQLGKDRMRYEAARKAHRQILAEIQSRCPHPAFHRGTAECTSCCVVCQYEHGTHSGGYDG